ncbi:MAG TPA: hypothetical protein VHP82_00190 [Gaiellaceae bacterium]|jgi:hypothetical protein|nr:hypothetical protein [Gaiellaceae bacterium]
MRRRVHAARDNLDWSVRLVWLPEAIRPIGARQIYSGKVGVGGRFDQNTSLFGILLSPLITLVVGIPVMAILLPLRYAGVMAWEVEAITWPWGKRGGPATVMRWSIRGKGMSGIERIVEEIAAALERGETQPQVSGARRES